MWYYLFRINIYISHYDWLWVDAYFLKGNLVFGKHISLVHPDTLTHYPLFTVPTFNSNTIIPLNTYVTMSNEWFEYDYERCHNVQSDYLAQSAGLCLQRSILTFYNWRKTSQIVKLYNLRPVLYSHLSNRGKTSRWFHNA